MAIELTRCRPSPARCIAQHRRCQHGVGSFGGGVPAERGPRERVRRPVRAGDVVQREHQQAPLEGTRRVAHIRQSLAETSDRVGWSVLDSPRPVRYLQCAASRTGSVQLRERGERGGRLDTLPLDVRHAREQLLVLRSECSVGANGIAQCPLNGNTPSHDLRVAQPVDPPADRLPAVGEAEDLHQETAALALVATGVPVRRQRTDPALVKVVLGGQRHVALVLQLAHRRQATCRTRVADDEHGVARLHAGGATPGEEVSDWPSAYRRPRTPASRRSRARSADR